MNSFISFGMNRLHLMWLLVVAAMLAACSPHGDNGYEDVLYQVECYCGSHPDSAQHILDTINLDALSNKEMAHICYLKIRIKDAQFDFGDETDSLLQIAQQYYLGSSDHYHEAQVCEAVARVGFKRGKPLDFKLDWNQKALQSIKKCQRIDDRLLQCRPEGTTEQDVIDDYKYKLIWRLSGDYGMGHYHDKAMECSRQAYQYFHQSENHALSIHAAFALAIGFLEQKDYDSCLMYCSRAFQESQHFGIRENLVQYHLLMSCYYDHLIDSTAGKEAQDQLMRQSIAEAQKGLEVLGDGYQFRDGLYVCLADAYNYLGQYDSCIYYSEKQLDFIQGLYGQITSNNAHANIYSRLYKAYEALGNQEKSLHYAKLYIDMLSELSDQSKNIEKIKNDYENQLELQKLESEQQLKRYRLYLLMTLILFALLAVCWLHFRYRKNREIEDLKFQENFQKLQSEYEQHTQHNKQVLIQRVTDIYHSRQDNAFEQILSEFQLQYPEVLDKLATAYPDLNKTEKHIIILSFLDFRAKEEADLLGLSENTVLKYRSNIKKKVDENLYMLFL